jgi:hypothetical protein
MSTARDGATATLLPSGKVLVTGGFNLDTGGPYLTSAELYDPASNSWAPAAPMSTARDSHTATLLGDGQVLVAGDSTVSALCPAPADSFLASSGAATEVVNPGDSFTVADFPGSGVWRYSALHGWLRLLTPDAAAVAVDAAGDVAAAFPGSGVWRYRDAGGWQQLAPNDAATLAVDATGEVAAAFHGFGVWRFRDGGGWQQRTTAEADLVAVDLYGDVLADLAGAGLWRHDDLAGWARLTPSNASRLGAGAS